MSEETNTEITLDQITAAVESNPELKQTLTASFVNKEAVGAYLDTEEGKAVISPRLDSYASKAIDGWKNKNLDGIVQQKLTELHPPESAADKQMAEMRVRLESIENEKNALELRSVASTELSRVGLGTEFLDFITGDSPETIKHRANALEVHISNLVTSSTDAKLANLGKGSAPGNADTSTQPQGGETMDDYTPAQFSQLMQSNPVKAQQIMAQS